jgi:hypothetical protein
MKKYFIIITIFSISLGCEHDNVNSDYNCSMIYREYLANGDNSFWQSVKYKDDKIISIELSQGLKISYRYDSDGNVTYFEFDIFSSEMEYDTYGNLIRTKRYEKGIHISTIEHYYSNNLEVNRKTFDSDGEIINNSIYSYDDYNRVIKIDNNDNSISYFYLENSDSIVSTSANGDIIGLQIINYDKGRMIDHTYFEVFGDYRSIIERRTWEFTDNKLARQTSYWNSLELGEIWDDKRIFYDQNSNVLKVEAWSNDQLLEKYQLFQYNSDLSLTRIETFLPNNTLVRYGTISGDCGVMELSDINSIYKHIGSWCGL